MTSTVRISDKSKNLLEILSDKLPGKPYYTKLVDDAIHEYFNLLKEKYDLGDE